MINLGCGLQGLEQLPAGTVDLVCSDLPSGATQAKFDKPVDLERLWPAVWRALKPSGAAIFMASNFRFAATLYASQKKFFRYDLIWQKSLPTGFLNAKKQPLRAHEFILVFSRRPTTYVPQMEHVGIPIHAATRTSQGENYGVVATGKSRAGALDRYPTSVRTYASVGTSASERVHPQQKPQELLRWILRTYTKPNAVVVDPCCGSGSMLTACIAEGRRGKGFEIDPRFVRCL